jgi:hypothetical protein
MEFVLARILEEPRLAKRSSSEDWVMGRNGMMTILRP